MMVNDETLDDQTPDDSGTRQGDAFAAGVDEQRFAAALELLVDELGPGRVGRALRKLADRLAAGASLREATDALRGQLPGHVEGMVRAGLYTGKPHELFEQFAENERRRAEQQRMMFSVFAYPMVVLALFLVLISGALLWIVPTIAEVYHGLEFELPWTSQVIFWLSEHAVVLFVSLLAGILLGMLAMRLTMGRWMVDQVCLALPLAGPVWSFHALGDFARRFGMLVEFGVPLPDALRFAADELRDGWLARASRSAARDVAQGRELSDALAARSAFIPSLVQLVRWGERTDSLGEALRTAGDLYEQRAELHRELARVVLPPVVLVFAGTLLGFFFWNLLLPLVNWLVEWA